MTSAPRHSEAAFEKMVADDRQSARVLLRGASDAWLMSLAARRGETQWQLSITEAFLDWRRSNRARCKRILRRRCSFGISQWLPRDGRLQRSSKAQPRDLRPICRPLRVRWSD